MAEWQTMETAPKERSVLAFEHVPGAWVMPHVDGFIPHIFVATWWTGDTLNAPRWNGGMTGTPTHWMPLPDPPKVE